MPRPTKAETRAERLSSAVIDIAHRTDDFSLRQTALLMALRSRPTRHATVRGLAAEFDVPRPSITRSMDRLVEAGFAFRLPDPADGRSILMALTPAGVEMADAIMERLFVARLS